MQEIFTSEKRRNLTKRQEVSMTTRRRAKLKREFPGSITLSNLKKNGYDRVHQDILQTIFGVDDEPEKADEKSEE